ncbi:hypothetical protein HOLleu_13606 [Holothuria leucospilota]|uniref:Uncharacterized protein n=1 Tax=Holothuria leucospilota TaxID=206669 RepID=A0A9Q1CCQ2_HOLLE|nr:hypothetical protein HOLleu_13606 [Holothuria leucospilota]
MYHSKSIDQSKIEISKTLAPGKNKEFIDLLEETLDGGHHLNAEDTWNALLNNIYSAAITTCGKRECKNDDWFETSNTVMEPVINAKCRALIN